jgi:hypothetical protein
MNAESVFFIALIVLDDKKNRASLFPSLRRQQRLDVQGWGYLE